MLLLIGQLERDRKQRGTDMQQRPSPAGLEPGPTAASTIASVHGGLHNPLRPHLTNFLQNQKTLTSCRVNFDISSYTIHEVI